MTILLTVLILSTQVRAEPPTHVGQARAWAKRMLTFALKGRDADEKPGDSAARSTYRRSKPLGTFTEIVLHEVAMVRTEAESRDLDEMSMEPLLALARERNPELGKQILDLLEMLDAETFELMRGTHGKLLADHFYVHPLTLRLLQWFPAAGRRPLFRADVFFAQAAELYAALLEDRSLVVLKGTSWAVLDAAIALQDVILERYRGAPGLGDHNSDRDALTRAFTRMQIAIQKELLARTKPIFKNEALCALRLEASGEPEPQFGVQLPAAKD